MPPVLPRRTHTAYSTASTAPLAPLHSWPWRLNCATSTTVRNIACARRHPHAQICGTVAEWDRAGNAMRCAVSRTLAM